MLLNLSTLPAAEHAVLIRVRLSDDELGTIADDELVESIEDAIRAAIECRPSAGHWDGHEFGGGWAVVFCYGHDAMLLRDCVTDAILSIELDRQVHVYLDSEDSVVVLSPSQVDH